MPSIPIPEMPPPIHKERAVQSTTSIPLSIAPMMDRTDRHFRTMMRFITQKTLLYTEMVTTGAILFGKDRDRFLGYDPIEHPIALQLGGEDPKAMAECTRIAAGHKGYDYDEVNINVGCPSDRVQNGAFGACLMAKPERVAACVSAMRQETDVPITVKHRIGIDEQDSYDFMAAFVDQVTQAGAAKVTVHARIAYLQGLNPKQNRNVPPLRYQDVYRLKTEFSDQVVEINGGIRTHAETQAHLEHVDAVMIGRAAYDNPMLFAQADDLYFSDDDIGPESASASTTSDTADPHHRAAIATQVLRYMREDTNSRGRALAILGHLHGLMTGVAGAKQWRRALTVRSKDTTAIDIADQLEHAIQELVR